MNTNAQYHINDQSVVESSVQWSRTLTVHSDRDELIMFIKFLFPYHLQLINPRTLNGRLGHLKCEVIE